MCLLPGTMYWFTYTHQDKLKLIKEKTLTLKLLSRIKPSLVVGSNIPTLDSASSARLASLNSISNKAAKAETRLRPPVAIFSPCLSGSILEIHVAHSVSWRNVQPTKRSTTHNGLKEYATDQTTILYSLSLALWLGKRRAPLMTDSSPETQPTSGQMDLHQCLGNWAVDCPATIGSFVLGANPA
jgi:hypothetical protein